MAQYYRIPLTSDPDQSLQVTVPVDGRSLELKLRLRYNLRGECWTTDVTRAGENTPCLVGLPLLPGIYPHNDLLEQYRYLELGSAFCCQIQPTDLQRPDDATLGTAFCLLWGDTLA